MHNRHGRGGAWIMNMPPSSFAWFKSPRMFTPFYFLFSFELDALRCKLWRECEAGLFCWLKSLPKKNHTRSRHHNASIALSIQFKPRAEVTTRTTTITNDMFTHPHPHTQPATYTASAGYHLSACKDIPFIPGHPPSPGGVVGSSKAY